MVKVLPVECSVVIKSSCSGTPYGNGTRSVRSFCVGRVPLGACSVSMCYSGFRVVLGLIYAARRWYRASFGNGEIQGDRQTRCKKKRARVNYMMKRASWVRV